MKTISKLRSLIINTFLSNQKKKNNSLFDLLKLNSVSTLGSFNVGHKIEFGGMKFYLSCDEDAYVFNEIFINQIYGLKIQSPSVIIDIGANIGLSALYFSKVSFVEKIYCFEPVKETSNVLLENLRLNNKNHKVCKVQQVGLSDRSENQKFLYNNKNKATVGIRGKKSPSYKNNQGASWINVELKEASIEVAKIIEDNPNYEIVLKIDCEGSEYMILRNIFESGLMNKISMVLMEWHDDNFELVSKIFDKANFNYFFRNEGITGMIYAFRKE